VIAANERSPREIASVAKSALAMTVKLKVVCHPTFAGRKAIPYICHCEEERRSNLPIISTGSE